jgi:membrane-associated PAP2 superfamily phosphatase
MTLFKTMRWQAYRFELSYLSVAIPSATLSVSLLKRLTTVDCPWSIVDLGGKFDYIPWWQSLFSTTAGQGHCFPAGHASSAYMFFGLYFVSTQRWPNYQKLAFLCVIILGLIFGIAQQLRGAHFVSHDMTSALICWLVSYGVWCLWQRKQPIQP